MKKQLLEVLSEADRLEFFNRYMRSYGYTEAWLSKHLRYEKWKNFDGCHPASGTYVVIFNDSNGTRKLIYRRKI